MLMLHSNFFFYFYYFELPYIQICSGWSRLTAGQSTPRWTSASSTSGSTSWRTRSSGRSSRSTPCLASLTRPSTTCSTNTRLNLWRIEKNIWHKVKPNTWLKNLLALVSNIFSKPRARNTLDNLSQNWLHVVLYCEIIHQ